MDNIWENKQKILSGIKNLIIKDEFISSCCSICGCSLKFKTRSLESSCPIDKWPALNDKQ